MLVYFLSSLRLVRNKALVLFAFYRSASNPWADTRRRWIQPFTRIWLSFSCWLALSSLPGSLSMKWPAPSSPGSLPRSCWLPLLLPSSWDSACSSSPCGLEYMSKELCWTVNTNTTTFPSNDDCHVGSSLRQEHLCSFESCLTQAQNQLNPPNQLISLI